jgi:hypothetical protein
MRIRPRSPYEGLTYPRRQPPTRSANRNASDNRLFDFRTLRVDFVNIICAYYTSIWGTPPITELEIPSSENS